MALKKEQDIARQIRDTYIAKPTEKTNLEQLKELDKKVKRPANIFSYVFGSVGSLVLGTGMCMTMGFLGGLMPVGIAIGLVGIGMTAITYPLHKKILSSRKAKYSNQIITKSNEILNSANTETKLKSYAFESQKQNTTTQTNYTYTQTQSNIDCNENGMEQ